MLDHCANGKIWLTLIYPLLTQPVFSSSRFILKDLLKYTVSLHEEHRTGGLSFLFFEDEELTILNGHTTSSIVKRRLGGRLRALANLEESHPKDVDIKACVYKSDCFAMFSLRTWLSIQRGDMLCPIRWGRLAHATRSVLLLWAPLYAVPSPALVWTIGDFAAPVPVSLSFPWCPLLSSCTWTQE